MKDYTPIQPRALNTFQRLVANTLATTATQVDQRTAEPRNYQTFREVTMLSFKDYPYISDKEAERVARPATLARVICSLAQWMAGGPHTRDDAEGPYGLVTRLPRIPGLVEGSAGLELPSGMRLRIDVLQYFCAAFHEHDGLGGYRLSKTVQVTLRCLWWIEPDPGTIFMSHAEATP